MVQSSASRFQEFCCQARSEIDAELDSITQYGDGCPPDLREAIRHSLLGAGKRLRPLLVLMTAGACGCPRSAAMPAACAVEMVHTYSLIHDDLPAMDDDDLRRGRPTCHKVFGEATAILAGDALLAGAFEVLATLQPADLAARCCGRLASAAGAAALVGGQADDLAADRGGMTGGQSHLESIHRRKTGAIFEACIWMGAEIAGATDEQQESLATYGKCLGLAFQITDDLLDVRGEEQFVGKRTGKDHQVGKLTFPALLGTEESALAAEKLIATACDAAQSFGEAGEHLESLARFVLERDR